MLSDELQVEQPDTPPWQVKQALVRLKGVDDGHDDEQILMSRRRGAVQVRQIARPEQVLQVLLHERQVLVVLSP